MALRNRQDGKVEIFVGTQKIEGNAKNIIEFDELALKTDVTAVGIVAQTNGFTITKGTTPKTLTVALDATVSGTNTGDETKSGLFTKLGVPGPFIDDAAAATGGVSVGGLYYVTTTLVLQSRVS